MEKLKRMKLRLLQTAVIAISVVAVYGIATAPSKSSDITEETLKQEFEENQKLIDESKDKEDAEAEDAKVEETDTENTDAATQETTQTTDNQTTVQQTTQTPVNTAPVSNGTAVTCVGDSVMLGAANSILNIMPGCVVDAKESRQVVQCVDILSGLAAQGNLGSTVVISLGTNSPFRQSVGQEIIDYLGPDRQIYWVTAYGQYLNWQDQTNSTIRALADANANVTVISWDQVGSQHPDWFYSDGIHLNQAGREGYANLIASSIQ